MLPQPLSLTASRTLRPPFIVSWDCASLPASSPVFVAQMSLLASSPPFLPADSGGACRTQRPAFRTRPPSHSHFLVKMLSASEGKMNFSLCISRHRVSESPEKPAPSPTPRRERAATPHHRGRRQGQGVCAPRRPRPPSPRLRSPRRTRSLRPWVPHPRPSRARAAAGERTPGRRRGGSQGATRSRRATGPAARAQSARTAQRAPAADAAAVGRTAVTAPPRHRVEGSGGGGLARPLAAAVSPGPPRVRGQGRKGSGAHRQCARRSPRWAPVLPPRRARSSCGSSARASYLRPARAPATEHAQCRSASPAQGAAPARVRLSGRRRRLREEERLEGPGGAGAGQGEAGPGAGAGAERRGRAALPGRPLQVAAEGPAARKRSRSPRKTAGRQWCQGETQSPGARCSSGVPSMWPGVSLHQKALG